jgi:hypothetical protein
MISEERMRAELSTAVSTSGRAVDVANSLCRACLGVLEVDGASISLTLDGTNRGTFGASGDLSRRLDALQFTFGEGPCLDAVRDGAPVLVTNLDDPTETRWPAFSKAVQKEGISAVFALPVTLTSQRVGALDLYRTRPGALDDQAMTGGLLAAELARLPLLDVLAEHQDVVSRGEGDGWTQLASLDRVEVYQATGMIVAALDVDPVEALVRLRAHAFARGITAAELAWEIVERRLSLDAPDWQDPPSWKDPAHPDRPPR